MALTYNRETVTMITRLCICAVCRVTLAWREAGMTPCSIDPYLSGALVANTVTGIQQVGVITSTKVRAMAMAPSSPSFLPERAFSQLTSPAALHRQ